MDLIGLLFDSLTEGSENAIDNGELSSMADELFNKYLPPLSDNAEARNEGEIDFTDLFWSYARQGFITGFNAAKELLR